MGVQSVAMEPSQVALLLGASALAGAMNSVAGGGTLVAFPAALAFGALTARVASASAAIALTPAALAAAWTLRRELSAHGPLVAQLSVPAVGGGLFGAWLLTVATESVFEALVPWLVLTASFLILCKDLFLKKVLEAKARMSRRRTLALVVCVFAVSIYSGYFGAGKNLMMIALLTMLAQVDILEANAIKSAVVSIFMVVIAGYFLWHRVADVETAGIMAVGATIGSLSAARMARGARPKMLRYVVVAIGVTVSVVLAYQKLA